MTDVVVSLAKAVDVYPDEFTVLLKVINHGIEDGFLTDKERSCLNCFKDYFADLALNYGR